MRKRKFLSIFVPVMLACVFFAFAAEAVEQRAYPITDPLTLYQKPEKNSKSWEISLPDNGVKVPSAIRDKNNKLWYKVTVDGRTGWLYNEGVRLLMGGKSKMAANIYKRCADVRAKVMKNPGRTWSKVSSVEDGGGIVTTWKRDGGLFQVLQRGKNLQDIYFKADGANACKEFLGFSPINMYVDDLRKKVGTPTMRETPYDESNVDILSYEMSSGNMTMAFHLVNDKVEWFELYRGATGEADGDWEQDVLMEREDW